MKIEEAIQRLETHKEYISPHGRFTEEAIDMAIEALEKQVPMKTLGPELDAFSGRAVFSCGNCGERISPMQKYCLWCGQKAL